MVNNYFPAILKNDSLRNRLAVEIAEGRFPHAYIISGNPGSGKRTLALNIAAALACNSRLTLPCGDCDECCKILSGFSPDVIFIRKDADKKEFTVNLIREIKDSIYIAPNELEKRVYIIEEAETMNINAQNAFLKMLEEPPSYVVFLLLCSNTENLLETIKSRAPILKMEHIPADDIKEYLINHSLRAKDLSESDPNKLDSIVLSANGSIGEAISICEESDKHLYIRDTVFDFLYAITASSLSNLDMFCDSLPNDSETFLEFLRVLKNALRDIATFKHYPQCELLFFIDEIITEEFASRITIQKVQRLISVAEYLAEKLKFYIDIRLAATTFCGDARKIMIE